MNTTSILKRTLQALLITGISVFALAQVHAENPSPVAPSPTFEKPRLVLQITVDQMRGDFPMRYKDRLGEGGFRYLLEKGTHYINAHYQHADTETPIGHAALFTGTYPVHNGIVAGNWFDEDKGRVIYNCEDDRYPMIGKEPAKGEGRAPSNLLSSTIGDELVISNNGQSRMFSVSIKDRGAVLPGGHTGKAFWYSKSDGSFTSSTLQLKTGDFLYRAGEPPKFLYLIVQGRLKHTIQDPHGNEVIQKYLGILESINLPGLSAPICRNGQALVDGGLVNNVPADVLVSKGCNFVIAVSVTAKLEQEFASIRPDSPGTKYRTLFVMQTIMRGYLVQSVNMNSVGIQSADLSIDLDVTKFDLSEFTRTDELAAIGLETAEASIERIRASLASLDKDLFSTKADQRRA